MRTGLIALVLLVVSVPLVKAVRTPGVFWSDVNVRFVAPPSAFRPNSLQDSQKSLVMTAGTVGRMVDTRDSPRTASPDVTLAGLGIRSGWSVTVPNRGGQYQYAFVDPYLDVQVVEPTPEQVRLTMKQLIVRIDTALTYLQDLERVAPRDRIQAKVLPVSAAPIYYEHGSRTRAAGISLLLVVAMGVGLVVVSKRLARRGEMRLANAST